MTISEITLSQLHDAFEEDLGSYDYLIEFKKRTSDQDEPTEIDILFYLPAVTADLSSEENTTIVATAGMSSRVMCGPDKFIELIYTFVGSCNNDERKKVAEQLAWLAMIPFKQKRYFTPGMVLENFKLYPFTHCSYAVIADWGILAPSFLPKIQPPVRLLKVIPLYENEAMMIDDMGWIKAYSVLNAKGVIFDDYRRKPAL